MIPILSNVLPADGENQYPVPYFSLTLYRNVLKLDQLIHMKKKPKSVKLFTS